MDRTILRGRPVCNMTNYEQRASNYSQPPWLLKQCRTCAMLYLENPPKYEELEESFAWERTFSAETEQRRHRSPLFYKLGRLPKTFVQSILKRDKLLGLVKTYCGPGRILDIGCAGGHTLARFPPRYIPFGIEISHELSQVANARFAARGGTVIQDDALSGLKAFPPNEFKGVIMTSYLEHEVNPREVLLMTRRVLRANAKLIVKVPNFASWNRVLRGRDWCGFRFPDHVNYFTPHLLSRMLMDAGYKITRFELPDRLPTSDNMWLVAEVK